MDARSPIEKKLWDIIGPPLYYCADCLLAVEVLPVEGAEPIIKRKCNHTGQIIAPRKATCVGKGGMDMRTKLRVKAGQIASSLTGRSV